MKKDRPAFGTGRPRANDPNSDEALVTAAQNGDATAAEEILRRYRRLVLGQAKGLFLVGQDKDDLIQEGVIGLVKAIRTYKQVRGCAFATFATNCIRCQMLTAISKRTERLLPFSGRRFARDPDDIQSSTPGPERTTTSAFAAKLLCQTLEESLSAFEWFCLIGVIRGQSYREIAAAWNAEQKRRRKGNWQLCKVKGVDNALVRARTKAKKLEAVAHLLTGPSLS